MSSRVRVLSYNMNMLPRGATGGAFQEERIRTFLNHVEQERYDVICLQEVFAAALLPYVAQNVACFQHRIVAALNRLGYKFSVLPRQPSYAAMLQFGMVTDTGLIIVSKRPISSHSSYTLRSTKRGEHRALKGCLFAKLVLCGTVDQPQTEIVMFNVYLRGSTANPTISNHPAELLSPQRKTPVDRTFPNDLHVEHLCRFVHDTLEAHGGSTCPFILCGNFNIDGSDSEQSKQLADLIQHLQQCPTVNGSLVDVIFQRYGRQMATRPPRLFFQSRAELCAADSIPQRHDFLFIGNASSIEPQRHLEYHSARLEKFHAPPLRPYVYLSDHFGVSVDIDFLGSSRPLHQIPSKRYSSVWQSWNALIAPYTTPILEVAVIVLLAVTIFEVLPWSEFVLLILLFCASLRWLLGNTVVSEGLAAATSVALLASTASEVDDVGAASTDSRLELSQPTSVWSLWEEALEAHRWQRCLGQRALDAGVMFDPEWLTFAQCDARIRDFGSGLLLSYVGRGETVGIMCGSARRAAFVDLACLAYGVSSLALAGSQPTLRQILDARSIRVVICGRASVITLLECRSRSLQTIITLQPTEYDEEALAKDLNVQLVKFETIEGRGRGSPCTPCPIAAAEAPFTLVVESSSVNGVNGVEVSEFTQHDLLRAIDSLQRTKVLTRSTPTGQRDTFVWHAQFSALFHRIFALAMLFNGHSVACAENTRLQDALRYFQPTVLVAPPSLFYAGEQQFHNNLRKWSRLYRACFLRIYKFRSQLIHEHRRDSSTLRKLFFRSFQKQIGGKVRKLVINASDTSTPFTVHEFVAVCYTPCIREVFFTQQSGILAIDGVASPHTVIQLKNDSGISDSIHTPSRVDDIANIGNIQVALKSIYPPHIQGPWKQYEITAAWMSDGMRRSTPQLKLLGPADAILWPVDYLHACAQDLEREYSQCRYVFDIFVTCDVGKPLVAVVYPNKDLIEWEWASRFQQLSSKQLSWPELVQFSVPLMLHEFERIAQDRSIHPSQRIDAVHLHPHAFSEHSDFLTPHGKLRRGRLTEYFHRHVQRLYGISDRICSPTIKDPATPCIPQEQGELSVAASTDAAVPRLKIKGHHTKWELRVPVAVDIGGTFAKVVYLRPPGTMALPSFVQREYNSLERTMLPDLRFFRDNLVQPDRNGMHEEGESFPGELCFARLESKMVPSFVQFLQENDATSVYKQEHVAEVRATGGGAFKYAPLVQSQLGVRLRVVKEMDSIVWGLNLLIRAAPETIFTVDPDGGTPAPHMLDESMLSPESPQHTPAPFLVVNIGSGISIVKVIHHDGTYERVGGSAIGGATFWGLVRTMTDIRTWDEVLETTRVDGPGDNTNVDLLVGDIYGYNAKELPSMLSVDTVASTFGKLGTDRFARPSQHVRRASTLSDEEGMMITYNGTTEHDGFFDVDDDNEHQQYGSIGGLAPPPRPPSTIAGAVPPTAAAMRNAGGATAATGGMSSSSGPQHQVASIDIVRSLLIMIANNVTQLAYLHCRTENTKCVFFTGGFVRDNPIVWRQISKSMKYWSKGTLHPHFLAHDGYLGALGTATIDLSR